MSTEDSIRGILRARRGRKITPRDDCESVWILDGHARAVEDCKVEILGALLSERADLIVVYEESPQESAGSGSWPRAGESGWRVPQAVDPKEMLAWLYLGNWQLYPAAHPIGRIPDLVRASPGVAQRFLASKDLPLIIDSFHDDDCWAVCLRECSVED